MIIKNQPQNKTGYFQILLINFLSTYHPHLLGDVEWIDQRCKDSESIYIEAIHRGVPVLYALEEAKKILYEGLGFSLYRLISDCITEHFANQIQDINISPLALAILPLSDPLMESYQLHMEEPENTPFYKYFELEVIGIIQNYLDKHGI